MLSLRILYSALFFICSLAILSSPANAKVDLQQLIDQTEEGETLHLPSGIYEGNIVISKEMNIIADEGVILQAKKEREPAIVIEAKDVSIQGLLIRTSGKGVMVRDSENVQVSNLTLEGVHSGIEMYRTKNVKIQNITVTGKDDHYSKKGNGIAMFNCENILVENSEFTSVQDGVYIEHVKDITVQNISVENSRYGTHFMYSENVQAVDNNYTKNVTGLMVMMTKDGLFSNNQIYYQEGFNGTGITFYEVENADIHDNNISGNRVAITIQRTTHLNIHSNIIQMNQTAIESISSDQSNMVTQNYFVGNLVNVRSDMNGVSLQENYYDDYAGIDLDDDGIGDETYVALQSFGQWMVRKPVYQYYVEAPSVVLLNQIDQQTNKAAKQLLVDETPTTNFHTDQNLQFEIHIGQLIVGLILVIGCLIIWRRSVLA